METVQFNEEPQYARPSYDSEKLSWLAKLVIKTGLAKDNIGAQKVLLGVFVLAVIATILIWIPWGNFSRPAPAVGAPGTPANPSPQP